MSRTFSLLEVKKIVQLAHEAGRLILAVRAEHAAATRDMDLLEKQDGSPVTRADHAAEDHIVDGLDRIGLGGVIIAEESLTGGVVLDGVDGYYLIDPLDGTSAFVQGRDDFSVNIGFVAYGRPVMGVLHVPTLGETYYSDGAAAYMMDAHGYARQITAEMPAADGLKVITNRTEDWSGKLKNYLAPLNVKKIERLSSAHKLALVAEGAFDLYPRFGRTYEWDIAAGDAILRAAGGAVETLDGKPLGYGKKDFINPAFVARGRR